MTTPPKQITKEEFEKALNLPPEEIEKSNREINEWLSNIKKQSQQEIDDFSQNEFPSILNNIDPSLRIEPYTFEMGLLGIHVFNGNNDIIYDEAINLIENNQLLRV